MYKCTALLPFSFSWLGSAFTVKKMSKVCLVMFILWLATRSALESEGSEFLIGQPASTSL